MRRTRAALIRAGTELIAKGGLDRPSLDAICERAGRTRGAFYVHFRDRDDFLVAVMERVGARYLEEVLGADAIEGGLGEVARRFLRSVATGSYPLTRRGGVPPHQLLQACARSPAIRARYVALVGETIARVAHLVRAGQTAGALRDDVDPDRIAGILLALVIGAQTMLELEVPFEPAAAASAMFTLLGDHGKRRP